MKNEKIDKFRGFVLGTFISIGTCMVTGAISPVLAQDALDMIIVQGGDEDGVDPDYAAQNETFVKNKVMGGQDLLTIPTTVNVIDAKRFDLDTMNYTDGKEVLNRVPGMSGSRNLRVDCGWCDYTVNLQNGMATRPFGSGNYSIDSANNYDIERIEIIKGPASALYPSNAFGGVVDVITKGAPEIPEAKIFGDIGSWGRRRGGFSLGGSKNGFGFSVNGFENQLDGWREGRSENKLGGAMRFNYDLSSSTTIQAGAGFTNEDTQGIGSLNQAEWDEDWGQTPLDRNGEPDISESHSKNKMADASIEHKFSGSFKMKLSYGLVNSESEGGWSDTTDVRHDVKPRFTKDFNFWKSQLITGLDFSHDTNTRIGKSEGVATMTSPYAQYAFSPFTGMSLMENLKFTTGVRYESYSYENQVFDGEHTENTNKALTPHLGATYKLNENNTVWVSYSEGVSVPSLGRMFPTSSSRKQYIDNPDLDPEEATNWEVGVRGNVLDGIFAYDVAWHDLQITNFMMEEEVSTDVFQYQNIGGVSIRGLEAQIALWPVKWAGVEMAYTYGIHKFTNYVSGGNDYSGNYMRRSIPHRLNTRFIAKPIEGAKVSLEWDYNSAAHINYDNTQTHKRPDLFHLSASYKLHDIITVWGQMRNLTDVKYADRVSADDGVDGDRDYSVGLPRSWAFGLSGKIKF